MSKYVGQNTVFLVVQMCPTVKTKLLHFLQDFYLTQNLKSSASASAVWTGTHISEQ